MIDLIILWEGHVNLSHHASSDWALMWAWDCWCNWGWALSTPNFVRVIMYFVFSLHLILLLFYFFIFIIILFLFYFYFYFFVLYFFLFYFIFILFYFVLILFYLFLFYLKFSLFSFFYFLLFKKKNEMKKREDQEVSVRSLIASWPWSWWLKKEGAGSNICFQPYPTSRCGKGTKQRHNKYHQSPFIHEVTFFNQGGFFLILFSTK